MLPSLRPKANPLGPIDIPHRAIWDLDAENLKESTKLTFSTQSTFTACWDWLTYP